MLELIDAALRDAPSLNQALIFLQGLTGRQREILRRNDAQDHRVERICRESLEQIARYWGYNHPTWLNQCLPLVGYRPNEELNSEEQFARTDVRTDLLPVICQCATLVGNMEAIAIAIRFIPFKAMEYHTTAKHGEPAWGLLHFTNRRTTPASQATRRGDWIAMACFHFRRRYGVNALTALHEISPAYRFTRDELPDSLRVQVLQAWAFRDLKVPPKFVQNLLTKRVGIEIQLALQEFPSQQLFRRVRFPAEYVCANALQYFPPHLLYRRLADLIKVRGESEAKQHQECLDRLSKGIKPRSDNYCLSMLGALGAILYGVEAMGLDLQAFYVDYLNEAEGMLKSRIDLHEAIEAIKIDVAESRNYPQEANEAIEAMNTNMGKPPNFPQQTNEANKHYTQLKIGKLSAEMRKKHLQNSALVCALSAHLFQVQFQMAGSLHCRADEGENVLNDLNAKLQLLGIRPFTWEFRASPESSALWMSILFQPHAHAAERGELIMIEGAAKDSHQKGDAQWILYHWAPPHEVTDALPSHITEMLNGMAERARQ